MRVLGGISVICIITHKLDYLGTGLIYNILLYICSLLSFILSFYLLYITYQRVKYMVKTIKSDKLDV